MKTLIIGSTGKTGLHIIKEFLQKEGLENLVAAARDPEKARHLIGNSEIEIRRFDYNDSTTWNGLLKNIKQVYLIAPPKGEKALFQGMQLIHMMKEAHIKKIIFLSGRTTGDIPDSILNKMEKMVQESGITYCIIRPGWFMQNFVNWFRVNIAEEDAIFLPASNSISAFIDIKNIAEVVYVLFHSKKWNNEVIPLTGSELLSHYEVASILSEVLERKIAYMPLPDSEYIHAMLNRKWPEAKVKKMVALYSLVKTGKENKLSDYYKKIVGKYPTTFLEFVKREAHVWKREDA